VTLDHPNVLANAGLLVVATLVDRTELGPAVRLRAYTRVI
jgi:hypothetical protein